MGARGPKRTPTQVLLGKGGESARKAKARGKNEPEFKAGDTDPPEWLSDCAKGQWVDMVKAMDEFPGMFTDVDRPALAICCTAYAQYVAASEELAKSESMVMTAQSGYKSPDAYLTIANKAAMLYHKYAAEFGFTPASRTRVAVGKKKSDGSEAADKILKWG